MRNLRRCLSICGLLLAARFSLDCSLAIAAPADATPVSQTASALPASVLTQLRSRGVREDQVFVIARPVRASGADSPAWSHNGRQAVQVASLVKLLTTGAALSRFGAEHGFRTDLLGQRPAGSDVLNGPVYLRGSGDPDFQVEDLWMLLRQLRQSGIRELRGPLVLDDSAFAHKSAALAREPEGSFTDDGVYRAYHARPSAVLIGHGSLGLVFRPSGPSGGASSSLVSVEAPLAPAGFRLDAQVQAKSGECTAWKDGFQVEWPEAGRLRIRGTFPVACGEQRMPVRVPDANAWLAMWFTDIWQQLGGQGPSQWENGRTPAGLPVLQSWRGRDLGLIVRHTNKFSNNVMAQNLMLALTPSGQTTGDALIKWVTSLGVDASGLQVGNGSGLSRTDRVPPGLLADVLDAAYATPNFPDWLASLPRGGADGTLSRRFGDLPVSTHLKTGRLRGVSGLAGYLRDGKGRFWVWVSVLNGEQLEDRSDIHDILLKSFTSVLGR